jgi:hypothetical protein
MSRKSFSWRGRLEADNQAQRNVGLLLGRAWFDIPIVYTNQRRAIIAIEKGSSGEQVFKTVLTAWGEYPDAAEPTAAAPENDSSSGNAR